MIQGFCNGHGYYSSRRCPDCAVEEESRRIVAEARREGRPAPALPVSYSTAPGTFSPPIMEPQQNAARGRARGRSK